MTTNADNVIVALTGGWLTAPVGTTAPTDTDAAWSEDWIDLGYISEDGLEEEPDDDTQDIPAWQNGDTVRTLINSSKTQFTFTSIEVTKATLELYYKGSTVTGTGSGPATMAIGAPKPDPRAFGFDVVDGDRIIRTIIPRGEVVERGQIAYKNDEPWGFELTIQAYPSTAGISVIKMFSSLDGLPDGE